MSKTLNEKINESIAVLEGLDKENLELGKYVVNEDFFYLVQEYETKDPEIARHEAHEKYVDIQYMIQGKEQIDIAPAEKMEVEEPYNADRDVVFFKEPEQATHVVLTDGGCAVLNPTDSHKPGRRVGKAAKVRKIVGKVRI